MANTDNPISADFVTVDPNFDLPAGVAGIGYVSPEEKELEDSAIGYEIVEDEVDNPFTTPALRPPDYITVVSQVMRQATDGRFVVDVILEVDDMPTVTKYEVGITKA